MGDREYHYQKTSQQSQSNASEQKVINVISTNSEKKAWKRQRSEEDDAPSIVTLDICHCIIKWILVDMGSANNVLFKKAFDQIGISPAEIEP